MPSVTFTREDIHGGPLDAERHELLLALTALDLADQYRTDKYVRPLIRKRLEEIENERRLLGLKESDPARHAEGDEP
jgi:hypothetical protein